jgi:hypothetical protein
MGSPTTNAITFADKPDTALDVLEPDIRLFAQSGSRVPAAIIARCFASPLL